MTKKIEEIIKLCTGLDGYSLDDIEELEEIESTRDANREPKYIYVDTVYKYIPDGTHHIFIEQQTKNGETGSVDYYGEVKKKEVTTVQWV